MPENDQLPTVVKSEGLYCQGESRTVKASLPLNLVRDQRLYVLSEARQWAKRVNTALSIRSSRNGIRSRVAVLGALHFSYGDYNSNVSLENIWCFLLQGKIPSS